MNLHGETQRRILAHIGDACKRRNVPPLDRGLRSIVAQQVRNLLVRGWPATEIEQAAVNLALTYDRWHGHKAMTSLQAHMEVNDEDLEERKHIERMALEHEEGIVPEVIKAMGLQRVALPDRHSFINAGGNTCRICTGPLGVHTS